MIGMELRDKVAEYVKERILALRTTNPGQYQNVSVVRTNSMKYLPNYFEKGQLTKMFFLFPDPHFKEKNHRRRVISPHLLDEYAYVLEVGGIIYTITDVGELGEWMKTCLDNHPMFEALTEEELQADPAVKLLCTATEEGQKVARNGGQTFQAVYRRIALSL
jgi:tRNA (guanine-N7-)-methyltransferase